MRHRIDGTDSSNKIPIFSVYSFPGRRRRLTRAPLVVYFRLSTYCVLGQQKRRSVG
jgi:hypothetical protein